MTAVTCAELLADAQSRLVASDSARLDAELLLAQVLGLSRAQLYTRGQQAVSPADASRYAALIERRAGGEPVAYLLGEQGFWSLSLQVDAAVLVPRPETELLVAWALECLADRAAPRIADLGTGSGAIALALACERADADVVATDLSTAALAVARGNAQALDLTRVRFLQGHWFEPLRGTRYDLVVSNPPYIAHQDPHLHALRHEPLSALSDGGDGLTCLREIVAAAPDYLAPGAYLLVEHGYDQGETVPALFAAAGFVDVEMRRDLNGQPRASGGCWRG